MKHFYSKIIIALLFIFTLAFNESSFALVKDTVRVSALPPGNLNNFINGDTIAGGYAKPNRVYLLQQTGDLDTVYYMTAPISVKGSVFIVGKINPKTGHPPVIAPSIAEDNSSIGYFFAPQGDDTLSLKGLYFMGTRTDGISFTGRFVVPTGNNNVFIFDHCVVENISGAGTPNLFDTWNTDHNSFYITNCLFRNNQDDNPQNPGFAWIDPGTYPCDTAVFHNNTFFIMGGYILGSSGYGAKYLDFQHNTIFFTAQGGAFDLYQMHNAVIKNNIFYSVSSAAYPTSWYNNTPGSWGSAVIPIDSLRSLAAEPYNMKEEDRHITITNNVYYWPKVITDKWNELNAGIRASDPLRPPDFINAQPGMLTDKTKWPHINVADNLNVDPGFDPTLVQEAGSKMAEFIEIVWVNGGTAQGQRPYVNPFSNPPTWENVATDWYNKQGYPVPENLRYSGTVVGDDGKPVGDLNWFPEMVGVSEQSSVVPSNFELKQNFPNPFNPATEIIYSVPKRSYITLKVYNLLGQEVTTLVNEEQNPGTYKVLFNAKDLASGVYLYVLNSDNYSLTKKMVLLK